MITKKHIIEMKKIVLVALVLLSTNFSFAQWDYNRFIGGNNTKSSDIGIGTPGDINTSSNYNGGIRSGIVTESEIEEITPLAPATLLLLGLGGCAVGATVYRNTRKEK
jgi:hypothetical protein